jgi:hypothetical protein
MSTGLILIPENAGLLGAVVFSYLRDYTKRASQWNIVFSIKRRRMVAVRQINVQT